MLESREDLLKATGSMCCSCDGHAMVVAMMVMAVGLVILVVVVVEVVVMVVVLNL